MSTVVRIGPGAVTRARRDARLHGVGWAARSLLAGKWYSGLRQRRRMPGALLRAHRAWRADGTPMHAIGTGPTDVGAVVLLPAGPRSWPALQEAIDSIRHYEPGTKIVVADDHSVDCRAAVVQAAYPDVDVVRTRLPCCGPVRLYTQQAHVLRRILARYRFDVLLKLDTDALLTGPGLFDAARARFAADPALGILGAIELDADASATDTSYERWCLSHELRWSPRIRRLVRGVEAAGHDATLHVQGGAYLLHRRALDALAAAGRLNWRQPWWSQAGEDNLVTLHVLSEGFTAASFGGPGEPIATLPARLPLSLADHVAQGKLVAHSVRRGADGEDEAAVRAFFAAAREA